MYFLAVTAPSHDLSQFAPVSAERTYIVWKALPPPYDSYWVSDTGDVGSTKPWGRSHRPISRDVPRKLAVSENGTQHWVTLRVEGKTKGIPVARLVALAFLGPPPEGKPHVVQKNGDTWDNRPLNLEYTDDPVAYWTRRMKAARDGELTEGDMLLVGDAKPVGPQSKD